MAQSTSRKHKRAVNINEPRPKTIMQFSDIDFCRLLPPIAAAAALALVMAGAVAAVSWLIVAFVGKWWIWILN